LKNKYADAKIILGGHSLGGALAFLAARDLFENGIIIDGLYTFG